MSSYRSVKLRYITKQSEVMGVTRYELRDLLSDDSVIKMMTGEADVAWYEQWRPHSGRVPPNGGWNWPELRAHFSKDPQNLCVAMWAATQLCGLMIARINQTACVVERIESSPVSNHPFRKKVLLVGLDAAARYAQTSGRSEVWIIEPANEALTKLYVEVYGFECSTTKQGQQFCRRKV
jgi:hypothetical protein